MAENSCPWNATPEEEAEHGPYADFEAWKRWFNSQQTFEDLGGGEILSVAQDLDYRGDIVLYCICMKIWEESQPKADVPVIVGVAEVGS